jgi:hypothetical protein
MTNEELIELAQRHGIPNPMRLRSLLDLSNDNIEEQVLQLLVAQPDLRRSEIYRS